MKKWTLLLALLLCLTLVVPCTAESAAYVPGEISSQLVNEALMSGKMLGGSMTLDIDLNEAVFSDSEDEQAVIRLLEDALDDAVLSGAFGLTGEALRLELGAVYGSTNPASVSAAADLTLDGVSVESDLIPGEKITAKWETLLALAGMSDEDIAVFTMLKSMDYEELLATVEEMIGPMMEMAGEYAAPYAATLVEFASTLPIEMQENVPADDTHPAAASRITVSFTGKDIGRLITTLADQLEADENVSPLLEMVLAQMEQDPESAITTTAELCAQLRALAAQLDGEIPCVCVLALDETGTPVYGEIFATDTDQSGVYFGLITTPGETPDSVKAHFEFSVTDSSGAKEAAVIFEMTVAVDPADSNVADVGFTMSVTEEDASLMSMDMSVNVSPLQADLPGYENTVSMTMDMDIEGESGSIVMTGSGINQLTAEGGEYVHAVSQTETNVEGMKSIQYVEETMIINPTADGFAGTLVQSQKMPDAGINEMTINASFSCWTHVPAALTELALENATNDDMARLETAVMGNGIAKLGQLMALLPPELVQMMMAE